MWRDDGGTRLTDADVLQWFHDEATGRLGFVDVFGDVRIAADYIREKDPRRYAVEYSEWISVMIQAGRLEVAS